MALAALQASAEIHMLRSSRIFGTPSVPLFTLPPGVGPPFPSCCTLPIAASLTSLH